MIEEETLRAIIILATYLASVCVILGVLLFNK